jgi:hypothetical protein
MKQGHLKQSKIDDGTIYIRTASIEKSYSPKLKQFEIPSSQLEITKKSTIPKQPVLMLDKNCLSCSGNMNQTIM